MCAQHGSNLSPKETRQCLWQATRHAQSLGNMPGPGYQSEGRKGASFSYYLSDVEATSHMCPFQSK